MKLCLQQLSLSVLPTLIRSISLQMLATEIYVYKIFFRFVIRKSLFFMHVNIINNSFKNITQTFNVKCTLYSDKNIILCDWFFSIPENLIIILSKFKSHFSLSTVSSLINKIFQCIYSRTSLRNWTLLYSSAEQRKSIVQIWNKLQSKERAWFRSRIRCRAKKEHGSNLE